MKKRLISMILMLAMVISTAALLSGCKSEGNVDDEGSIKPMTITLAMITDKETTPKGIQAVQDALNRITENTLNTHLVLQFYTAEEYDAAIQAKIKGRITYQSEHETDLNSMGNENDKVLNEYGREVTAFPEPYENQIDIFLVNGINNLESYMKFPAYGVSDEDFAASPAENSEDTLADLSSYLTDSTSSARLITKYIPSGLIDHCKFSEALKAIPSNTIYGNAEYMLIDKALFDKYSYDINEVTDIISLEAFLNDIAEKETGVTPLYNYGTMGMVSLTGRNSAVATYIPEDADPATGYMPASILTSVELRRALTSISTYARTSGKFPVVGSDISGAEKGKFAVGYVNASPSQIADYQDDYYTILTGKAAATTEQVYDNAFAVSSYTTDVGRCMEIITLIQTNREFHNILLYGVENVTYTVNEDTQVIQRKHEGTDGAVYTMDMNLCGNLFLTQINSEMTATELVNAENDWALAKESARNITYSPYMGFELELGDDNANQEPNAEVFDKLEKVYNEIFELYKKNLMEEVDENGNPITASQCLKNLDTWIVRAENGVVTDQTLNAASSKSIKRQYMKWWSAHYST